VPNHELGQVTLLPAQLSRLASLAQELGKAIGVSQDGSVLHINTGESKFDIDARGNTLHPPTQEKLL
jgi:hypothetical protein